MSGQLVIRRKRRQRGRPGLSRAARAGVAFLVLVSLTIGALAAGIARLYLEVVQQVPAVQDVESFFQEEAPAGLRPSQIVDASGGLLWTLEAPGAEERLWVGLQSGDAAVAPEHLKLAILARQDPSFWQNRGYVQTEMLAALAGDLLGRTGRPRSLTISEQLISNTLLPVERYPENSFREDFRLALLAERLNAAFDKQTILTWYLNAADFGPFVHGADAASLVYFGKHVDGLTLGESALLAALPGHAEEVLATPAATRIAQRETLDLMVAAGMISKQSAQQARAAPLRVNHPAALSVQGNAGLMRKLIARAESDIGPSLYLRGGLTIVSTTRLDLQQQAACALKAQVARLNAGDPNNQQRAAPGVPCLAAGLLSVPRPGDVGVDHAITSGSVIVMSPSDGTLLAAAELGWPEGDSGLDATSPSGGMVYPFIYLTAFSRGLSPGSMVLDLPAQPEGESDSLAGYRGPERMRTALANGDSAAAARTLEVAGMANVSRTLQELALIPSSRPVDADSLVDGDLPISLLDLSSSYAVVANQGLMVTAHSIDPEPVLIRGIDDLFGRRVYSGGASTKVVLGEGLSYLLLDVLSDGSAADGPGGLVPRVQAGGSTAAVHAANDDGTSWTIMFTPTALVGVRLDSDANAAAKPATPENATDPLAEALLRYVSADQPAAGWGEPDQVSEVEVCNPSGLLPTVYCPDVVTEVFLQGTEPTALDDLYQPFRVNKESGRLATLQTPLELVEERVYQVPPPEAATWAQQAGIERPPNEYDPLVPDGPDNSDVAIGGPEAFANVGGDLVVSGQAHPSGLRYYRLQIGQGLNPARWTQIGEDHESRVWGGELGRWDTSGLSGLYTLQLIAVLDEGEIITDSVPVTIDNQPPMVEIREPQPDELVSLPLSVELEAADDSGIAWVDMYLDGQRRVRLHDAPYRWMIENLAAGEHELSVRAEDGVGNQAESAPRSFTVAP